MTSTEPPWHAVFPAPTLTADVFPQKRALMVLSMKIASMLIVDVRRTDYEGGCIRGSINIPAQGFYWSRGMLYELAYKANMEWVVFTCGSCKEGSRGARSAAMFLEHVRNTAQDNDMQVMVLEGGMKGWVKGGEQYIQFMDGFNETYWQKELGDPNIKKPDLQSVLSEEAQSGQVSAPAAAENKKRALPADIQESSSTGAKKKWSWEALRE